MDFNKMILKFIWRGERPRIANIILKEKNEVGGLTLPNFKTYYKLIIKLLSRRCGIGKRIDKQINFQKQPRNGPCKDWQLIFDKGAKTIQWSKDRCLQQMVLEQLDMHMQKNESGHKLYTLHNKLRMDHRPKGQMKNYKTPRR